MDADGRGWTRMDADGRHFGSVEDMLQQLKLGMTKLEDSTKVLPQLPLLNSHSAGWNELFLAYYHHPGYETPAEHLMAQHVLDLSDRYNWVQHERRIGDR